MRDNKLKKPIGDFWGEKKRSGEEVLLERNRNSKWKKNGNGLNQKRGLGGGILGRKYDHLRDVRKNRLPQKGGRAASDEGPRNYAGLLCFPPKKEKAAEEIGLF